MTNKRNKRAVSVMLLFALVITGIFAFLSSTDVKTNVFTIGEVEAELHEICDVDGNGSVDYDETHKEVNFTRPIMPGDEVTKAPYVKNTGETDVWVVATVAVPTATAAQVYADADGDSALESAQKNIIIKSYVFQDGFENQTTIDGIWAKYVEKGFDFDGATAADDTSDRMEIFKVLTNSAAGFNETYWTVDDDVLYADDGYNYYTLLYKTKVAGSAQTQPMFTDVKLIEEIGDENPADKIKLIFKINGVVSETKYCNTADDTFIAPALTSPLTIWKAENGEAVVPNSTHAVEDYYIRSGSNILNEKCLVFEAAVSESANVTTVSLEDEDHFVKLVPSSITSTAMIERNSIVETYNEGFEINQYMAERFTYIKPITNAYGNYVKDFNTYFVYGLKFGIMDPEELNDYVTVIGDGRMEVEYCRSGRIGTGTVIKVYDRMGTENIEDDVLAEQFYVIIFGDLNCDTVCTTNDYGRVASHIYGNTILEDVYNIKAADVNSDGEVTASDYRALYNIVDCTAEISQITGLIHRRFIEVMFKENGVVTSYLYLHSESENFVTPALASPTGKWEAENGEKLNPNTTYNIGDYLIYYKDTILNKIVVFESVISETAHVNVAPSEVSPSLVKLVPKTGSTAMVERDCVVETYNTGFNITPYMASKYTYTTPITNEYGNYTKNPETYFIYGLAQGLTPDDLDDYVTVLGGGSMEVECLRSGRLGTGSVVKVKDTLGNLVEQFYIIIFGDVNSDSLAGTSDYKAIGDFLIYNQSWSVYKLKAADLNCDNMVTAADYGKGGDSLTGIGEINQITGYQG